MRINLAPQGQRVIKLSPSGKVASKKFATFVTPPRGSSNDQSSLVGYGKVGQMIVGEESVPTTYDITIGFDETTYQPKIISGNMTEAIAVHNAGGKVNMYMTDPSSGDTALNGVSMMYLSGYLWFGASDELEDPNYNGLYGISESVEFTEGTVFFSNADGSWNSKNGSPRGIDQAVEQGHTVFFDVETASGHEFYRATTVRNTASGIAIIGGKYTSNDSYVTVVDGASESHDYLSLYDYDLETPHFTYGMLEEESTPD